MSPTDAAPAHPVLSARGLRKSFAGVEVLRGIDLEIARGEVIALIGPSGSGKTTVLRSLNSLEIPDAGVVSLADGTTLDFSAGVGKRTLTALRDRSAMVFQHFNLFPHLTVLENVTEARCACSAAGRRRWSRRRRRCSSAWAWAVAGRRTRSSCPAGSSSAWASSALSPSDPICCSSTSPPRRWIQSSSAMCCR